MKDVFDIIVDGRCVDCDMDPAQCYEAGYCAYSEDDEEEEENV